MQTSQVLRHWNRRMSVVVATQCRVQCCQRLTTGWAVWVLPCCLRRPPSVHQVKPSVRLSVLNDPADRLPISQVQTVLLQIFHYLFADKSFKELGDNGKILDRSIWLDVRRVKVWFLQQRRNIGRLEDQRDDSLLDEPIKEKLRKAANSTVLSFNSHVSSGSDVHCLTVNWAVEQDDTFLMTTSCR